MISVNSIVPLLGCRRRPCPASQPVTITSGRPGAAEHVTLLGEFLDHAVKGRLVPRLCARGESPDHAQRHPPPVPELSRRPQRSQKRPSLQGQEPVVASKGPQIQGRSGQFAPDRPRLHRNRVLHAGLAFGCRRCAPECLPSLPSRSFGAAAVAPRLMGDRGHAPAYRPAAHRAVLERFAHAIRTQAKTALIELVAEQASWASDGSAGVHQGGDAPCTDLRAR